MAQDGHVVLIIQEHSVAAKMNPDNQPLWKDMLLLVLLPFIFVAYVISEWLGENL